MFIVTSSSRLHEQTSIGAEFRAQENNKNCPVEAGTCDLSVSSQALKLLEQAIS